MAFHKSYTREIQVTPYSETLTKAVIDGFKVFAEQWYLNGQRPLRKGEFLDLLSKNARQNFTRLQYFGLIEKGMDKESGWMLTKSGEEFYAGRLRVRMPMAILMGSFGGEVIDELHPLYDEIWASWKGRGDAKPEFGMYGINDHFPSRQKTHSDYANDKREASPPTHADDLPF